MFTVELTIGARWKSPAIATRKTRAINIRDAEIFARSWLHEVQKTCLASPPNGYRILDEDGNPVLKSNLSAESAPSP